MRLVERHARRGSSSFKVPRQASKRRWVPLRHCNSKLPPKRPLLLLLPQQKSPPKVRLQQLLLLRAIVIEKGRALTAIEPPNHPMKLLGSITKSRAKCLWTKACL